MKAFSFFKMYSPGKTLKLIVLLFGASPLLLLFQNCSASFESLDQSGLQTEASVVMPPASVSADLPAAKDVAISACMNYDNKNSALTWCGSYEMMAHLALYRGTHDLRHLLDFVVYSQKVIEKRDDRLGFNGGRKTWSQTNYTEGVPYPTLVGEGMITYPLADFAALILLEEPALGEIVVTSPTLHESLKDLALGYLADVRQNITEHEAEWNPNLGGYRALPETANYFKDVYGRSVSDYVELPFNMSMAMGRTLVTVHRLTGDAALRTKVEKLVQRWKNYRVVKDGAASWPYSSEVPRVPEDVSHAAIDVDFLRLAYENGVGGVTRADLAEVARTFSTRMYYHVAGVVSYHVDGETRNSATETFTSYVDAMSWLPLSSYDEELKKIAIDASRLAPAPVEGYTQWTFAMMREFGGQTALAESCRLDSDCFSNRCDRKDLVCVQR